MKKKDKLFTYEEVARIVHIEKQLALFNTFRHMYREFSKLVNETTLNVETKEGDLCRKKDTYYQHKIKELFYQYEPENYNPLTALDTIDSSDTYLTTYKRFNPE
jgi:hypothetical protein